jgi:hypothetical protein
MIQESIGRSEIERAHREIEMDPFHVTHEMNKHVEK